MTVPTTSTPTAPDTAPVRRYPRRAKPMQQDAQAEINALRMRHRGPNEARTQILAVLESRMGTDAFQAMMRVPLCVDMLNRGMSAMISAAEDAINDLIRADPKRAAREMGIVTKHSKGPVEDAKLTKGEQLHLGVAPEVLVLWEQVFDGKRLADCTHDDMVRFCAKMDLELARKRAEMAYYLKAQGKPVPF